LFFELSNNKQAFLDFITSVKKSDGSKLYEKKIESYRIVIEPDFGKVGFGTTDAVITINNELLVFFEAKRSSFSESKGELTYQIELNYSLAKYLSEMRYCQMLWMRNFTYPPESHYAATSSASSPSTNFLFSSISSIS
jgi:hypothetical protein